MKQFRPVHYRVSVPYKVMLELGCHHVDFKDHPDCRSCVITTKVFDSGLVWAKLEEFTTNSRIIEGTCSTPEQSEALTLLIAFARGDRDPYTLDREESRELIYR